MYAPEQALIATSLGLILVEGRDCVTRITIGATSGSLQAGEGAAAEAARQILDYLAGKRHVFHVPLRPAATARGAALREAIVAVGYGETVSYGALAKLAASSARAIGQACARNPLPLIVPCHRVLASSGAGFYSAGNGLATKAWLLDHEQRHKEKRE